MLVEKAAQPRPPFDSHPANQNASPLHPRIGVLALDVDGVLTDGSEGVLPTSRGYAEKRINLRDLDALTQLHERGVRYGLLTGERGALVDAIAKRLGADFVISGAKDKSSGLLQVGELMQVSLSEICFIGDADRDAQAFSKAGLSLAPSDASISARREASRVLSAKGGHGVVAEAAELLTTLLQSPRRALLPRATTILEESLAAHQRMLENGASSLVAIAQLFSSCLQRGGKILFCGNGGSAADAQHAAGELMGRFAYDRAPLPALSLATDTSVLTAVGNDWEYDEVFARQVRGLARPSDVVVGLSTSGRSENVRRALRAAQELGARTVSFTGMTPGPVGCAAEQCVNVPSSNTPRIQELHILALHCICDLVETIVFPPTPEATPENSLTEE